MSDEPRLIISTPSSADRIFRGSVRGIGALVLVITGSIGVFLAIQSVPTLRHYGLSFFTEHDWQPEQDVLGISAVLLGTLTVALVALVFAFPLALTTALFITDYAPPRLRSWLISGVDLMAAVPSIIFGLLGRDLLAGQLSHVEHWIYQHASWVPIFQVNADPNDPTWQDTAAAHYEGSAFIAGVTVSLMVFPMACAVMRQVFAQAPAAEREAAYALGATRWGMIRTVVLPFGRGGVIGGTMLALGRALGETIAVVLIVSPSFEIKSRIFETGSVTVSSLIAGRFGEASSGQLSALLTAGFVLFVITLAVNTVAATIVGRSRSGAATEA